MEIIEQPVNKGLAQSIVDGVSFVINEYGSIIVVEDDCIVSPYFLRFMNQALSYYKNDSSVGSISGWTPNLKYPVSFIADEFSILRSCSICWGTWADRWEDVDWDMNQYELIRHNQELIKRCNKTGNDRFVRYIRQKKFNLQSWSIRFGMTLVQRSQRTIYPRYSYAENIGHDSRGTHDNVEQVAAPFQVGAGKAIQDSTFLPANKIMADASIEKQFRRIYGGNVLQRVKKYLYIHGVEKFMDIRRKS
ncbi:MAG: hypothetical protein LIO93_12895 [Bacteroidales bacterium]|nr:hypothetical protein [Bacteroidales bacterium]